MTTLINSIIDKYQGVAPQKVVNAVASAAKKTGADFSFLMEKASTESGFNPSAKSKNSSATGLFQFIESTWLQMVKEHGAKYGLGTLADKIQIKDGKPCVTDCDARKAILNLRKNPEISALMAGELSASNKNYLKAHTDANVGDTELYLAHFMGAGRAAKFINTREENGDAAAARLFPREAHANKKIFYAANGRPRSLDEVYNLFAKKFQDGAPADIPHSAPSRPIADAETVLASAQDTSPLQSAQTHYSLADIIWDDEVQPRNNEIADAGDDTRSGFQRGQKISGDAIAFLAQIKWEKPVFNS